MRTSSKQFLSSLAIVVGLIVGVGIFGIPYAISQAGVIPGIIYFVLLGGAMLLTNLFYGEVSLRTHGRHRLVGYAEKYLGRWGKVVASIAQIFGFYGGIIAYIIVGGEFLFAVFNKLIGGEVLFYQVFIFIFVSVFIIIGLKLLSWVEVGLTGLLLLIVLIILFAGLPHVQLGNYKNFELSKLFLPYGVILFSIGGSAAIPEIKEVLKRNGKMMKKVIILGMLIAVLISIGFGFIIAGVSGSLTSDEALSGLSGILSEEILFLGLIFGILSIITSLLVVGINLKETFLYDYEMKSNLLAWFLAICIPFFIFLSGSRGFIKVISITGSIFGGMVGFLIILMFLKAKKEGKRKPEYQINIPKIIPYFLMGIFSLGIAYEVYYLFMNGF